MNNTASRNFIISIFVGLYILTSAVSTIHVIDFFRLSNPEWLAITLAVAFEIGAASCLAALIVLDKTSKILVALLFALVTFMQIIGNMYYAYSHLQDFLAFSELFGIEEEEIIFQKRIISFFSGAILPIVALGFIKSLIDYIKPTSKIVEIESRNIVEEDKYTKIEDSIPNEEPVKITEPIIHVNRPSGL